MKAYVNGVEVSVMSYYIQDGIQYCKVHVNEQGWITNVPTSMVEIR